MSKNKRETMKEGDKNPIQQKLLGANLNDLDLEKLRKISKQLSLQQQIQLNGKVTDQSLKQISGKFSLDIIFSLNLSNQKLVSIEPLSNCINMMYLDISNNKISSLKSLEQLKEIQFLAARNNEIGQLKELRYLNKLVNLQLQGNQIESIYQIDNLSNSPHLNTLYLQTATQEEQNPVCSTPDYRNQIYDMLKKLNRLDGLPKQIQELPNANELSKPKDLQNQGDQNSYWYCQNFKNEIEIKEDLEHKSELRKLEQRFQQAMYKIKNDINNV